MLFDNLAASDSVDPHRRHRERLARRRHTHKCSLMRPAHGEPCGYLVAFSDRVFERPLNVRESGSERIDGIFRPELSPGCSQMLVKATLIESQCANSYQ
jgi:hypothetical protein